MTKRSREDTGDATPRPADKLNAERLPNAETDLGKKLRCSSRQKLPSRPHHDSTGPVKELHHHVDDPDTGPHANSQQASNNPAARRACKLRHQPKSLPVQGASTEQGSTPDGLLSELQQAYMQQLQAQQELEQRLAMDLTGTYKSRMEAFVSTITCSGCNATQLQQVYSVQVLIIDVSSSFTLDVPVMLCCSPGCSCTTAIQPLQLSCWPCAAASSMDLTKAPPGEQQTWFTLRLMSHAHQTTQLLSEAPVQRYSQMLAAHAADCGCQLPVAGLDLLLGPALLQYQRVRRRGSPTGQHAAAAAARVQNEAAAAAPASSRVPSSGPRTLQAASGGELHDTAADMEVDPPQQQQQQQARHRKARSLAPASSVVRRGTRAHPGHAGAAVAEPKGLDAAGGQEVASKPPRHPGPKPPGVHAPAVPTAGVRAPAQGSAAGGWAVDQTPLGARSRSVAAGSVPGQHANTLAAGSRPVWGSSSSKPAQTGRMAGGGGDDGGGGSGNSKRHFSSAPHGAQAHAAGREANNAVLHQAPARKGGGSRRAGVATLDAGPPPQSAAPQTPPPAWLPQPEQQQQQPKPPQQQEQPVKGVQRRQQPLASMYQVAFRSAPDGAATVAYQHVLKESKQQPPSDTSSVPAAAAAAAAADRLAEDADQVQSASTRRLLLEDSVVVVGKGGGGVVYLLQQQEPHCLDYPQQVALKLAWAGSSGSHDNEEKVLSALRPDLPHVAHLLGTAQGSSAGEAVRGLVYEYYSGGDLHCWVLATTRQAAQEPDMQQQCPEAAEAHMPESGPPDEQLAFKSFVDKVGVRGGVMAPLRKLVLEQPLKRMMRGLLELLVQISSPTTSSSSSSNQQHKGGSSDGHNSSSSSSHDDSSSKSCHGSATNPPGVVIHGDVKPQNIYVGSTGRAVLGDWGSALYSPSPKQLKMKHMPFTFRYAAPEVLLSRMQRPTSVDKDHPALQTPMLSQDQGKADTFSLVTTWLHVLSGIPPWFWLWRDAANEPMIVYKAMLQGYGLKEVLSKELAVRYAHMLSPGALAFFQEALVIDPKQRPTPAQLLEHPYLADAVDS